jgi:hypothetical protein
MRAAVPSASKKESKEDYIRVRKPDESVRRRALSVKVSYVHVGREMKVGSHQHATALPQSDWKMQESVTVFPVDDTRKRTQLFFFMK